MKKTVGMWGHSHTQTHTQPDCASSDMYCHVGTGNKQEVLLEEHCTASGVPDCAVISCKCWVFLLLKCFAQKGCVCCIFIVPRQCLNYPDTFSYVGDDMTFRSQTPNFTPLIKKCYELHFGVKRVTKIKFGPLIFVA